MRAVHGNLVEVCILEIAKTQNIRGEGTNCDRKSQTCMWMLMLTHIDTHAHTHTHTHAHTHIRTHFYVRRFCMYQGVSGCSYAYHDDNMSSYTQTHTCNNTYTHAHTHTRSHLYEDTQMHITTKKYYRSHWDTYTRSHRHRHTYIHEGSDMHASTT